MKLSIDDLYPTKERAKVMHEFLTHLNARFGDPDVDYTGTRSQTRMLTAISELSVDIIEDQSWRRKALCRRYKPDPILPWNARSLFRLYLLQRAGIEDYEVAQVWEVPLNVIVEAARTTHEVFPNTKLAQRKKR